MTDIAHKLHQETYAAEVLKANLRDIVGADEELMRDMIEGETGLVEMIDAALEQISVDTALVYGLEQHIDRLGERKHRLKDRIESMRAALLTAMSMAEIKKRETPIGTVTVKAIPQGIEITDEAAIPAEFWKPSDPKLDRTALKEALKAKKEIPGAVLNNGGETIQVRFS